MKTTLQTLAAALAAFALISCATTGSTGGTASKVKPYPHDTCIVTDNKLGSMGDPITMVHGNQQVKFCCAPCVDKFKADPDYYLSQL